MQSVQNATGTAASGGDGDITYKREQIVGVSNYGLVTFDNVTFFKNGRPITDTPSLYDALGMKDRATDYRDRTQAHETAVRRGAWMSGLGTLGLTTFGTWALISGSASNSDATIPLALTAGSVAVMIIGFYELGAHPAPANLTPDEAISLVDEHNGKKKRVGLREPSSLHIAPSATLSGGGLVLSGSF
jgi:hypothetical protein